MGQQLILKSTSTDLARTNDAPHITSFTVTGPTGSKVHITSEIPAGAKVVKGNITIKRIAALVSCRAWKTATLHGHFGDFAGESASAKAERRIGLLHVRNGVQKSLESEQESGSFYFEVNGLDIFAGGK